MKDVYVVINIRCNTRYFKHTGFQLQPHSVLSRTRHTNLTGQNNPAPRVSVSYTESETNHTKDAYASEFSVRLKHKQRP